jgi:hypothetical protein
MNLDPSTLVGFHTLLSLVGIATGVLAVLRLFSARESGLWTTLFLLTAIATSVTGFFLPATQILPSHIVGALGHGDGRTRSAW